MKAKDIGILVVVAIVSGVISIILSGIFFSTPSDRAQSVEVVEPIATTFDRPTQVYFSADAINPAQNIDVGTDPNSNPFGGQSNGESVFEGI